ncbi:MAG: acetyl-CoA carboxylase biotin carboxyl carrier protein [Verrucomicrobiota bacterium]
MELKEIRAVIDLMTKNQLSEFELEKDNFKIKIKKGADGTPIVNYTPTTPAPSVPVAAPVATPAPAASSSEGATINSPMVGTFYRSPSPESPPFVDVGTTVNENTVVCIIEAMKVMNEIKAETSGVIEEILLENGKPIEFGQPLFKIKAA